MDAVLTDAFEAQRPRLKGLAYRMLGSVAEAEDAVQDAWLRWTRAGEGVTDPAAWLVRVTTRAGTQMRAVGNQSSYLSQEAPGEVFFGVADAQR